MLLAFRSTSNISSSSTGASPILCFLRPAGNGKDFVRLPGVKMMFVFLMDYHADKMY